MLKFAQVGLVETVDQDQPRPGLLLSFQRTFITAVLYLELSHTCVGPKDIGTNTHW